MEGNQKCVGTSSDYRKREGFIRMSDMNTATVLSRNEYEALIRLGLRERGVDDATVNLLLAARWPMTAPDLLAECAGRGRLLAIGDLEEWYKSVYDDPEPILTIVFGPLHVTAFLDWAVASDRGRPTLGGYAATRHPEVVEQICEKEAAPRN
jgi:hypothetical protein